MLARVLTRRQAESTPRHLARCLAVTTAGAALTALGAQVTVPWWPVPFTLQVFCVLLCGAALGRRWGAAAQAEYVLAGTLGLPVFAGGGAGPGALFGPTGGYLAGFVIAAYITGWMTERAQGRGLGRHIAALAGAGTIWLCGWAWLAVWMNAAGRAAPVAAAFSRGVAPFIIPDLIKAVAAATAARPLLRFEPKR